MRISIIRRHVLRMHNAFVRKCDPLQAQAKICTKIVDLKFSIEIY